MDQIDPVELLGVTFEDDDPQVDTRLRPLWRLGKFQDPRTEQLYCKWHHQLWLPRYTAMLILSTVIFNGSFVISFFSSRRGGPGSLKSILWTIRPDVADILIGPLMAARFVLLVVTIFVLVPRTRRLITPERYQMFVVFSYIVPLLVDQLWVATGPDALFERPDLDTLLASPGKDTYDRWAHDSTVFGPQCYYHASLCDFYMAALGGLSGLSTEYATAIGVIAVVMNQLHFQNIYSALDLLRTAYDGTEYLNVLRRNSLSVLWLYRLVPLLWMIGLSIVLETGQRREFQVRLQLKRQKDLRIEQLKREKERADWDRNLLARNSTPLVGAGAVTSVNSDAQGAAAPDACTVASCSEIEAILLTAAAAQPANEDGSEALLVTKPVSLALPIAGASTVPVQQVSCLNWEETRKFKSQTQLLKPPRVRASSSASSSSVPQASELSDCVDGSFTSEGIGTTCKPRQAALWRSLRESGLMASRSSRSGASPRPVSPTDPL